jgi:hypothetical protein
MRIYSDPTKANDKWTLPDVEIFHGEVEGEDGEKVLGWWYQFGLPGCMPDSEPHGPFESAAEAEIAMLNSME